MSSSNCTYKTKIPTVQQQIWNAQNKALAEIGKFVVADAKERAVVAEKSVTKGKYKYKKGALKRSIYYWVFRKEQRVLVGIRKGAWYGGFFEKGTRHLSAHPMITPAVKNNIAKIREIEAQTLKEELDKIR